MNIPYILLQISPSYFIYYVIDNIFVAHKIQFNPVIAELLARFRVVKQVQCPCWGQVTVRVPRGAHLYIKG